MGDRSIRGKEQISGERENENDLRLLAWNNWGVANEFQIEHAEFGMPSRHPGRNNGPDTELF